jgi:esterase/lipase superfamily enzyme
MNRLNLVSLFIGRSGIHFLLVVLVAGNLFAAGCTSVPDAIIGIENPKTPAQSVSGVRTHEIFVMTTRAPDSDPALFYSGNRSRDLGLAKVTVTIPPVHEVGKIERPASLPPDPKKVFTISDPRKYASDTAFMDGVRDAVKSRNPDEQTVLLFVHGYNTTFTAAVLRLAQFIEDSGYTGVPVLFSWASRGKTIDYVYDLNSALQARDTLIESATMLGGSGARSFDIVAHSMGNFLTVEAIRQAKIEGRFKTHGGRIQNIILASPDIDADVFQEQLDVFEETDRRFYVLISADDKALALSRRIAGGVNRVGDENADKLAALGVTVIDLTEVDDPNNLNHSKFADSPEVVKLIGKRLQAGDTLETGQPGSNGVTGMASGLAGLPAAGLSGVGRIVRLSGGGADPQ